MTKDLKKMSNLFQRICTDGVEVQRIDQSNGFMGQACRTSPKCCKVNRNVVKHDSIDTLVTEQRQFE